MNIYHNLNEMISYIEQNLDTQISYSRLSQFLGVNEYTMQSLFSLLCGITLNDYIRKRRLSQAGVDLYNTNCKIIDIAMKYGYENPTSFSRAFEKFHGIKPSKVKNSSEQLKLYPKLHFNENENFENEKIEYSIIEKDELVLYGLGINTTEQKISKDAPAFFQKMRHKYSEKYGEFNYGMTVYEDRFESENFEYWVLYDKKVPEFTKYVIPKSKWLCFHIPSENYIDIQKATKQFYLYFITSCKYNIKPLPELGYYHDNVTDFLVPIED